MGTVKYLLDTHTFLWAIRESKKLSVNVKNILRNTDVQIFVSAVSAYEIMNKHRINKLIGFENIANNFFDLLQRFKTDELAISVKHMHFAGNFEWSHRDPFDRILAAQSYIENLTLITNDEAFKTLPWIKILW